MFVSSVELENESTLCESMKEVPNQIADGNAPTAGDTNKIAQ